MWDWLNGPGAVFKGQLPRSTNYLTAYDRDGTLLRMKEQTKAKSDDQEEDDVEEEGSKKKLMDGPIPPETPEDLYPFAQNRQFRSQPVLSEEFKDEIYRRVVVLKTSVRSVSAILNVEMSRVGAVVRLKSVEKQWVEQVSPVLSSSISDGIDVMRNKSIGLKDKTTGYHIYYNSLITPVPTTFCKTSCS